MYPKNHVGGLTSCFRNTAELGTGTITGQDKGAIYKYMKQHINKEIKRQLKKTLRTSGRQIKIRENGFVGVFDRNFYENINAKNFLDDIDRLVESGEVLKNRPTSFLARVSVNDSDIVIKRYNHKSLLHSIRQSLQRSRARRSWLHGHRLVMLDINTPRPLACLEKRIGPVLWTSYIITKYVPGAKSL